MKYAAHSTPDDIVRLGSASDARSIKFGRASWALRPVPILECQARSNLTRIVIRFAVFCQECPFRYAAQTAKEYRRGCLC